MRWHESLLVMYAAWTVAQSPLHAQLPAVVPLEPEVMVTGCVQRESDDRRSTDSARDEVTVIGGEFVLVNSSSLVTTTSLAGNTPSINPMPGSSRSAKSVAGVVENPLDIATGTTPGVSYRLTGAHEVDAAQYLNRWVEAVGKVHGPGTDARVRGVREEPGDGPDDVRQLNLLEFELSSLRMLSGACVAQ